ncbi:MAG: arginine--tRNA ligase [Coxiella sp. RIFCSPHIGHO2_12_FULL_44_14]|nr:MAG: arginine--tRNA ligase [Coxiella sp. RIFCSPHIGHO2_12_FULL_44_14]
MKDKLITLLNSAIQTLQKNGYLPKEMTATATLSSCKDATHGDYASNCALLLAKAAKKPPRELAEKLASALPSNDFVEKTEIAGPGFINFFLQKAHLRAVISTALKQAETFGHSHFGKKQRVHIEYVSANPTGPLHVGHGRGAAYGASVANILKATGFNVHREYYVNDAGRQMRILTLSTWIRYLQLQNEAVTLPAKAYQGDYIIDIAKQLVDKYQGRFHHTQESIEAHLDDQTTEKEAEKFLDQMVSIAQMILGENDFDLIFQAALTAILDDIREDLEEFGVVYDAWFHESTLFKKNLIETSIELLRDRGHVYTQEGAQWFRATDFGDEKDRVLVRSNGITTYFASDVAYHLYKYQQGYHRIIDVFGADHHGYLARIRAFLRGLDQNPDQVTTLTVQFAILYRGDEKVSMSTRAGQFVTLRELRNEVSNDAARLFYIMRRPEQHLDFDLELAKSQSNENPVYYIQYAHARICSVWRQLENNQQIWDKKLGLNHLDLLNNRYENDLINTLNGFSDTIKTAAQNYEPHLLAHFLLDLATRFHAYYNAEKFLVEDEKLRNARLCLVKAIQHTLANGLTLLGISAPQEM